MELVGGRTLDQVIKSEHVLRPERVVRIGTQVCDALEGAHALQIVHRDLKPANIMLLSQGRDLVKVLDFGLAKSVAPDQAATTMTNAGALLGTPAYMPPELALGGTCDGRADLYSLGVILYLLGSGRLPFESDSAHELIAMHGHERAPAMTGVPPSLAAVIDRLLEKDPDKRYQSATDAREALDASLDSRMATPPSGTPFSEQTSPSLGPFPATSQQFSYLKDTPVAGPARSMVAAPARPSRGWLIPVLALAMIGAGAGVFVLMRGGAPSAATTPEPAPVATPAAIPTPAPAPPAPPPPPTPEPAAAEVVAPATPEKPPAAVTKKKPDTRKPATAKTKPATSAKTVKPPTAGTKPSTTPASTKPAATGSAAPSNGLPF
jgi:serine/threonine-protein kinase